MKKKIQKPFDAEAAKKGAIIETKNGHSVRILCYDKVSDDYPIVALVKSEGHESVHSYTLNGEAFPSNSSESNLVIVETLKDPQFEVDDYIVSPNGVVFKVIDVDGTFAYKVLQLEFNLVESILQDSVIGIYHKWTIKDSKPGDVLIHVDSKYPFIFKGFANGAIYAYCGIDVDGYLRIIDNKPWTTYTVRPATPDEEVLLFTRLKDEGYSWNPESLTLSEIQKRWRDSDDYFEGYYIENDSDIEFASGCPISDPHDYNLFATAKQAKSALAMARISQIMANDKRFGGVVTDEEWGNNVPCYYVILKVRNILVITTSYRYEYLGFHTMEQANLFLEENEDLVKDYYIMN